MPSLGFVLAAVYSCLLRGLQGLLVEVQVDVSPGQAGFHLVGLASASVREARERVRSAIRNSGLPFPATRRLTVNLAPAEVRKESPALDLPIAVAICLAEKGIPPPVATAFLGELALDGSVRHVPGVLVAARALRAAGFRHLHVGPADADEAALVEGIAVHPCANLLEALEHVSGADPPVREAWRPEPPLGGPKAGDDLSEVHGQEEAKRALEVAAAGSHHLLMIGPPGAGKTMLARCLPSLLPPLSLDEALEVAQVRSLLGELPESGPVEWERPFRSPHHGISSAGLVGGGSQVASPGEISRASNGVLFLDELAEFQNSALQALRQPIEQGSVTIARSAGAVTYPARILLVAATNPCPCGWAGDRRHRCRCTPGAIDAYQRALSGPLLDRIDLRVAVSPPPLRSLSGEPAGESSALVRDRVVQARVRQHQRQGCLNSQLKPGQLRRVAPLEAGARRAMERWASEQGLSARGFHRAWRVALTISDLEGGCAVEEAHVLEALGYRLQEMAA